MSQPAVEAVMLSQGVLMIRRDTDAWYQSLTPFQQRRVSALAGMVYERLSEPFKREIEALMKASAQQPHGPIPRR